MEKIGGGMRVTVGLIDKADASIVMKAMNRLFLDEYQLFVEDVRKSSGSDQSYKKSQTRLQNFSTPFNCGLSNNDLSYKASTSSTPLAVTNRPEQMYYRSPTCDASNYSMSQAMHPLSQAQALDSSISYLGRNSIQHQKSQYEFRDTISSMNHNIDNYSRRSQMSSSKNDRYSRSVGSHRADGNDETQFSHTESKTSRSYVREGGHRSKRSRSPHHNFAPPKIYNIRDYKRHDEPHRKEMSRITSGIMKRRSSPSNVQMHISKYPRKDSPAVFSSAQNFPQTSFPLQKYKEESFGNSIYRSDIAEKITPLQKSFLPQRDKMSHNQESFGKSSYSSGIAATVIPDLAQIQQPVSMTDLNNTVHSMPNNMFLFDKCQRSLPNTSQSTTSAKFNAPNRNSKSLYQEKSNKPAISPWDPNVVQFENMALRKREPAKQYMSLKKLVNKDEANRYMAVSRIMKEMNFALHKKIWAPNEPSFLEKFKFRQIFVKKLKAEVLRRINEMVKDELVVPIDTIVERYKNKYSLDDYKQIIKLINNKTNKKFAKGHKESIKKSDAANNVSTVQNLQNNSFKIRHEMTTKGVKKQQTSQSPHVKVQQDKAKLQEPTLLSFRYTILTQKVSNVLVTSLRLRVSMGGDDHLLFRGLRMQAVSNKQTFVLHSAQATTTNSEVPKWLRDLKEVACFIHHHVKQNKAPEDKTVLLNLKAVLFGELYYYKRRGYELDDGGKNDTLTSHLIDYYKAQKENLLVVLPVDDTDLPEFSPLCNFLQPYNIIGLRKFTSRNIYFVLLETKEECEKLYTMEKSQIGGKVVRFLPITEATDLFKGPLLHINTAGDSSIKDIKSENPGKLNETDDSIKSSSNMTVKTMIVTKNKSEIFNTNENINSNPEKRSATENRIKITEAVIKQPNIVARSPEKYTQTRMEVIKNNTNIEKNSNIASQNSDNALEAIKESTVFKNGDNPSVQGKTVDFIDSLPDDPLSDDEVEINMEDLEDY
ncbi:hypothetical protein EVAR_12155_1 [Eumeta japonica]|uniref:Uncharacterized protein n=1 Tax=Eumeta variegata TaxID=151549 RepID=A0A4C1UGZ9_EUMVA|nr:hypothetical protein EVAR_12155_1 [Eumeta japonica]